MTDETGFLGLPNAPADAADLHILPLPLEATVSYGRGTARGPAAILGASRQVELWDDELGCDLASARVHAAPAVVPGAGEPIGDYLHRVRIAAEGLRGGGVEPRRSVTIGVGGEHSLTPPLVHAAAGTGDLSGVTVVQFDAHADLRAEYDGTPHSHACAMRRLTEAGASLTAVGIRSLCREEAEYAAASDRITTFPARDLGGNRGGADRLGEHLRGLSGPLYVTIDVDGFDPALCPGTGTPEPGGLAWWPVLGWLRTLLVENDGVRLIGCDVVETVPQQDTVVNEFTAAKLIAKLIACHLTRRPA